MGKIKLAYDEDGRMTLVQTATVPKECVNAALTEFFDEIPEHCKLMLADPTTCAPICSSWSGKPD